jgi:hypothetical protein
MIFNFTIFCKVHFSFKKWRKSIMKTDLANYFCSRTPERTPSATSCAATSERRRTCRTRVRRARRGAGVTIGCSAASAWTLPWRSWKVIRARWRQSTGPAHHPRRAIGCRGDARRRPCRGLSTRACVTGVTSPTHNRPSLTKRRPPRPLPRTHAQPPPELRRPPLAPPRWAHCSAHFQGRLSTPKPSACTHRAYTHVCWPNRTAYSPEPELQRPPPGSHRRARPSAGSPSPGTHLAPRLGHMEATYAAHCWAPPSSYQNLSFRGHAATAPPPPLAGDISGWASAANRSLVSPIALLALLFASPSLTSPPVSAPPPSGYGGEGRGHKCELSKVGRGLRAKWFFISYVF